MSKPLMELKCGYARLTVWENKKATARDGYPVLNIKLERRCRNQKGDWHSSSSFTRRDLTDLETLCRAAYERLSVKERILTEAGNVKAPAPPENVEEGTRP